MYITGASCIGDISVWGECVGRVPFGATCLVTHVNLDYMGWWLSSNFRLFDSHMIQVSSMLTNSV